MVTYLMKTHSTVTRISTVSNDFKRERLNEIFHANGHIFLKNLVKLEIKNSVLEWQVFVLGQLKKSAVKE